MFVGKTRWISLTTIGLLVFTFNQWELIISNVMTLHGPPAYVPPPHDETVADTVPAAEFHCTCNFDHQQIKSPVTVVTAFWDIQRVGRGRDFYTSVLLETLSMNATFVVFGDNQTIAKILQANNGLSLSRYICTVTMDLKQHPYYKLFYAENLRVTSSPEYKSRIRDPDRIEVSNPLYNIPNWGKVGTLRLALQLDPFKSHYFLWVDAGLSRFWPKRPRPKPYRRRSWPLLTEIERVYSSHSRFIVPLALGMTVTSAIQRACTKEGAGMWGSDSYLTGSVLGGSRDVIPRFDDQVKEFLWRKLSKHNESGNDQIMLMAMLCERPETFRLVYSAKIYKGVKHIYTHLALLDRDILQFVDPQLPK